MPTRPSGASCAGSTTRPRPTPKASWSAAPAVRSSTSRSTSAWGSPTYGRHVSTEISAANWRQIWVPPGFAHGYVTLEPETEVLYKVTDYYAPECDRGIAWDDPALGIDWRLDASELILSEKDRRHPRLADAPAAFAWTGRTDASAGEGV